MLKVALLKAGLKATLKFCFKNLKSGVITFIVGFIIFLVIRDQLNHRAEIHDLEIQTENLQRMNLINAKKDSTASVIKAKEKEELKGLLKSQTQYTLEWKKKAMDLEAKQDTTLDGRIRVKFHREDTCVSLEGYTLTANATDTAMAKFTKFELKSFKITDNYLPVGDSLYSVVKIYSPCFKVKDHISLVPPEYRKSGSGGIPWKWILSATGIGYLGGKYLF